MGKSSSSINKKKRSKYSPQGRIRKRSKIGKTKSKKLRRLYDSVSASDDGSRDSVSSSSSEDSYRDRRSKSHDKKDVKASKKRARAPSSSSEDFYCVRKRKGSKRRDDSQVRKKIHKTKTKRKKKIRTDVSLSSRSSGSPSCSTCESPSRISDEGKHKRRTGKSERRGNDKRKMENVKSGTRRRHRSRSCSSCSGQDGSSDYLSNKKVTFENTSRRLRSVITSTIDDEVGRELVKDEHKEEIIYDHGDYPSCRSNDSNDVGEKKELAHQLHAASEKKKQEAPVSTNKTAELVVNDNDKEGQPMRSKNWYDRMGTNDATADKKIEISEAMGSVNSDELESVLRKKALENLRRFRGGPSGFQTNAVCSFSQKDKNDKIMKALQNEMPELSQVKSPNYDGARVVLGDSTLSSQNEGSNPNGKVGGDESGSAKNIARPNDQVAVDCRANTNATVGSGINKPKLVTSALKQAMPNAYTNSMTAPAASEHIQFQSLIGAGVGKSSVQAASAVTPPTPIGDANDADNVNNVSGSPSAGPSSCHTSAAGERSSNKLVNEVKDTSQLEQKTMSVMRGGEMVQVSYKVYIPKKSPVLARRQLKR